MRRVAILLVALCGALAAIGLPSDVLASAWGSSYGDPYGFCPNGSFLPSSYTTVITNDPEVGTNPEQNTFWGIHAYPGYDDWYGYWYGDFAGGPGGNSGWHFIGTSYYGQPPHHWNFADYGWAVHGHAKQYIAYYNWTFGGQCGFGAYGNGYAPPYMADVYGNPVVDIYVDSVPPNLPAPRATVVTTSSITFTWDAVTDRADGSGADAYASGMGTYDSWIAVGTAVQQRATTTAPRTLTVSGLPSGQSACLDVRATDNLGNSTPVQQACATVIPPPTPPALPPAATINVNPRAQGLTGLASWYWLAPAPSTTTTTVTSGGYTYRIQQTPTDVAWAYGDGTTADVAMPDGAGLAYPSPSPVTHVYQHYAASNLVAATVNWSISWWVSIGGTWSGPYSLPREPQALSPVAYPILQAQAELSG